jgi:hypothetical protein
VQQARLALQVHKEFKALLVQQAPLEPLAQPVQIHLFLAQQV